MAERFWGALVFPLFRPLSLVTGVTPVGVFDVLLLAYAAWLLGALTLALRDAIAKRRRWRNAALGGLRRVVRDGGAITCFFYVVWGFSYARPSLETRLGWDSTIAADTAELIRYAEQAVAAANRAYLELHGKPDAGHPTRMPADVRELDAALDEGWARAVEHLGLPASFARTYGRVKFPWSGAILSRVGISGVYVPFTAETYVPAALPAVGAAATMAHEKAHQRGVAREAEATFLGTIAGALAPHPLARYGAAVRVAGQLQWRLLSRAVGEYRRLNAELLPGIRRDLEDRDAYYDRYRNVTQEWQSALNDRYLRANRVRDGNLDYGRSASLLFVYARERGAILPEWRSGVTPRPPEAGAGEASRE